MCVQCAYNVHKNVKEKILSSYKERVLGNLKPKKTSNFKLFNYRLEELVLERGDSLKNLDTRAVLNIGNLTVTGQYKYKVFRIGILGLF